MIRSVSLNPVAPQERIGTLDALRGFALLGILTANWRGFGWPAELYPAPAAILHSAADRGAQFLIDLLCGNKFITLLSFLFGIGFAIQMERARDRNFVVFFCRRLAGLALIGLVHAFLIWWGDILLTYAAAGLLLLLFRHCRQSVLLGWAAVLAALPLWLSLYRLATFSPSRPPVTPRPDPAMLVERASQAYLHGDWASRLQQNLHDWQVNNADAYFVVLLALAWFLFGLFVWRSGFPRNLHERVPLLRKICLWGLIYGIAGSLLVIYIRLQWQPRPTHLPGLLVAAQLLRITAGPSLSMGYAAGIALLTLSTACPWLQRGLQSVGRTALSNYILQSLIGISIHYGFGLSLYAKTGALAALALSLAVFLIQMPVSSWYLSRWPIGPAEWLWRRITYGRPAS